MLVDLARGRPPALDPHAVLVVGSGAAGIAVAEQVAGSGRSVVVVESGSVASNQPDQDAADLNAGTVHGLQYAGLTEGRARTLGGTTALWHGQVMRLHDLDLEPRPWIPGSGWPFGLDTLDPFYARAESWLQVTGRGYDEARWLEHPSLPPIAWDPAHLRHDFTEYLSRPMLGRTHRAALVRHPRIVVLGNATATLVLVGDDGHTGGVEVAAPDGTRLTVTGRDVVLAAGAVENARLLQLSDPAGVGLGDGREHTGRYLQDHPIIRTAEVTSRDPRVLQDRYVALHRGRRRLFPKVRLAPEVQRDEELLDATAVFIHDHDDPALDAARRLVLAARSRRRPESPARDLRTALRAPVPVVRDAYRRYARGLATGALPSRVWLQVWVEQVPDASSRVTLGPDRDRFGLQRVNVDWRVADRELATTRRLTRLVAADLDRLGIASVTDLAPMHDDDAWRDAVRDAFHPSGTTRISTRPTDGVVDADLQVHGVPGLHVLGGSVFPVAGYANPTLTIVALAIRLGDRLASRVPQAGSQGATQR